MCSLISSHRLHCSCQLESWIVNVDWVKDFLSASTPWCFFSVRFFCFDWSVTTSFLSILVALSSLFGQFFLWSSSSGTESICSDLNWMRGHRQKLYSIKWCCWLDVGHSCPSPWVSFQLFHLFVGQYLLLCRYSWMVNVYLDRIWMHGNRQKSYSWISC